MIEEVETQKVDQEVDKQEVDKKEVDEFVFVFVVKLSSLLNRDRNSDEDKHLQEFTGLQHCW